MYPGNVCQPIFQSFMAESQMLEANLHLRLRTLLTVI
jgi:hypothetical protein